MTTITNNFKDVIHQQTDNNTTTTTTTTSNNILTTPMTIGDIEYIAYQGESQIQELMKLIEKELPEPYSIFTYRFFLNQWPELCFLAYCKGELVGVIISKKQTHRLLERGYIGMVVVDKTYRRQKIGKYTSWIHYNIICTHSILCMCALIYNYTNESDYVLFAGNNLVKLTIEKMIEMKCDEIVLETIITNTQAISLYENLGFIKVKRLFRYYTMGADAYRLMLPLNDKFLLK